MRELDWVEMQNKAKVARHQASGAEISTVLFAFSPFLILIVLASFSLGSQHIAASPLKAAGPILERAAEWVEQRLEFHGGPAAPRDIGDPVDPLILDGTRSAGIPHDRNALSGGVTNDQPRAASTSQLRQRRRRETAR